MSKGGYLDVNRIEHVNSDSSECRDVADKIPSCDWWSGDK